MSEAGCGQASRHRALPCAIRLTTERQQGCIGPSVSTASQASPARGRPKGRTHSLFTMSNNTLSHDGERCASRLCRWRIPILRTRPKGSARAGLVRSTLLLTNPIAKGKWWSKTGSNRRPHACKARALPTELLPQKGLARDAVASSEGSARLRSGGPGKTRTSDLTLIKRAL